MPALFCQVNGLFVTLHQVQDNDNHCAGKVLYFPLFIVRFYSDNPGSEIAMSRYLLLLPLFVFVAMFPAQSHAEPRQITLPEVEQFVVGVDDALGRVQERGGVEKLSW